MELPKNRLDSFQQKSPKKYLFLSSYICYISGFFALITLFIAVNGREPLTELFPVSAMKGVSFILVCVAVFCGTILVQLKIDNFNKITSTATSEGIKNALFMCALATVVLFGIVAWHWCFNWFLVLLGVHGVTLCVQARFLFLLEQETE
jgi:hypothetical protein